VFGRPGGGFPDTLTLQNFGGNLLFASPASLFFTVTAPRLSDTPLRLSYTISQMGRDRDEKNEVARDSLALTAFLHKLALPQGKSDDAARYLTTTGSSPARFLGVLVPLPTQKFLLRMFSLDISLVWGEHREQLSIPFRTVWPTMPFSLKDVDYALDALRFIVSPELLDSLQEGGYEERRENLETFWKQRDKTPGTAENELMTEYYRRVDHAVRNFGTLRIPDGSRTDRGKIYILYGPPTSTDRALDPVGGFQEIWIYEKLGKKFVFVDQGKSGNYVLSSSTGL
jgi:GWxTD domain-containing protein